MPDKAYGVAVIDREADLAQSRDDLETPRLLLDPCLVPKSAQPVYPLFSESSVSHALSGQP